MHDTSIHCPLLESSLTSDSARGSKLYFRDPESKLAMRTSLIFGILFVANLVFSGTPIWAQQEPDLQTVAEKSDYKATSKFVDVVEFVDTCASHASHVTRYDFGKSVEGRPMVAAVVASPAYQFDQPDERIRVLVIANIHSGECAGKEAMLATLRELAFDSEHRWLKDSVLVIVPNYNVDANERVGLDHRPGQVGPAAGMGVRENAQQLDLNRDFVKLESPEARSLIRLMDEFDPHMFIDCHTTNGSNHRYVLTYDIPHNPSAPKSIRDYMRNRMMPEVTERLEKKNAPAFYYGNFSENNSKWTTYGHEPRYSTEYAGMRGILGVLSEAYSYIPYRERIDVSLKFVRECVDHVRGDAENVKKLVEQNRVEHVKNANTNPQRVLMHIDSRLTAFDEPFTIRGFKDGEPQDYEVEFWGKYEPTVSVALPYAYLLPAELSLQVERLMMHGVQVEKLDFAQTLNVEVAKILQFQRDRRPFQHHLMATASVEYREENRSIPAGTYLVRTGQPLGKLASYMMEPEANEGFVKWNFMDDWMKVGDDFPIVRVAQPTEIAAESIATVEASRSWELSDIFGPDRHPVLDHAPAQHYWLRDGKSYAVQKNGRWIKVNANTGAEESLISRSERRSLSQSLSKIDGMDRDEINRLLSEFPYSKTLELTVASDKNPSWRLFQIGHRTIICDIASKRAKQLGSTESPVELVTVSPSGDKVAYVRNGNLFALYDFDEPAVQLTHDGSEDVLNGKLDWVYQEELYGRGNFKGFWWSPDSDHIAFLRLDETEVRHYTVTDHLPTRGSFDSTRYPKAGDPLPKLQLGIASVKSGKAIFARLAAETRKDHLISQVGWNRAGDHVVVQLQNREQTWLDLLVIDPELGKVEKLFRDQTAGWIESPGNPVWLEDGSFVWLSPRSGFKQLYHYSASGEVIGQITPGDWSVASLVGTDARGQRVFFTGSPATATEVHLLSVGIDGQGLKQLTQAAGIHNVKLNQDRTCFFDTFSSISQPAQVNLHRVNGELLRSISRFATDKLKHWKRSEPAFVKVPVEGGTLPGQLIKPENFDPSQKYPVLVFVYSGPQTPVVRNQFGRDLDFWHQYLAQQGFVIWKCDNRSSAHQGLKNAWPIHRNLGTAELADIESGVAWLKNHDWIDEDRIGIWGWSYGGYMTAFALTHSDTFKTGISVAPVTDWKNYDAIYTERFMDTPQNNPAGYEQSSVLNAIDRMDASLLLVHGSMDDNVHISNALQMVYAMQKANKPFDLMIYPKCRHGIRDPQQRLHLFEKMTKFLKENLKR